MRKSSAAARTGPIKGPLISRLETWNRAWTKALRPPLPRCKFPDYGGPETFQKSITGSLFFARVVVTIWYRDERRRLGGLGEERWSRGGTQLRAFPRLERSVRFAESPGRTAYKEATRLHSIGEIKRGHARVVNSRWPKCPGVSPIGGWLLVPCVRGKGRNGACARKLDLLPSRSSDEKPGRFTDDESLRALLWARGDLREEKEKELFSPSKWFRMRLESVKFGWKSI